jgi:flagellar hook protein FlgE
MSNIASDIAQVASTTDNMQLQEVNVDLIKSITEQIPVAIAYEANAGAIKVKNAVADTVLNLKA